MTTKDMFTGNARTMWDIRCARCGEWKDREEFPQDKRKKNGRNSWCKDCHLEDKRERYANNTNGYRDNTQKANRTRWNNDEEFHKNQTQKMRERNRRARADPEYRKRENKGMLLRRYGLTEEEYEVMVEATCGKCPICEVELDSGDTMSGQRAVVDHCHACGSVYGSDGKPKPIGNPESVRGIVCENCNINSHEEGKASLRWTIHLLRHEAICEKRSEEEREVAESNLRHLRANS